jgi:hypothetical protein
MSEDQANPKIEGASKFTPRTAVDRLACAFGFRPYDELCRSPLPPKSEEPAVPGPLAEEAREPVANAIVDEGLPQGIVLPKGQPAIKLRMPQAGS